MSAADVADFLARLVWLDPGSLVRMRPEPDGVRAWAMLPFRVLVCRPLPDGPAGDLTVGAADLLATVRSGGSPENLRRRDGEWRWPLPSSPGREVETIPVAEVIRLAAAAARTVRTATTEGVGGRAVGERILRDALLDHVAIVVTTDDGERVEIPQRMVQALARMGFLGTVRPRADSVTGDTMGDGQVTVRLAMGWIGLAGPYGSTWYRPISPLRIG